MAERPESTREADDQRIVRLLQARDSAGLRDLLAAYGSRVEWWLKREFGGCLSTIEIDEALNQAAYSAWQAAGSYDPRRGTLRAWFYVIARNSALQVVRREQKHRSDAQLTDPDHASFLESQQAAAEPVSERQRAFLQHLEECIEKLPKTQKQIVRADLASGDVADAGELAAALQTTRNSIYASRSIARKTLRNALAKFGERFTTGDPPAPRLMDD